MAEESIGTARIDIIVDADQARAAIEATKNRVAAMGTEFQQSFA